MLELDDGSHISEVFAICQYIEALHPEPPLMGATPEERARVSMWNAKVEQQGLLAMMETFRNSARGLQDRALTGPRNYGQIPELAERGRERVAQFFKRLDGHLADNAFVAGERFSIADISALTVVDFAKWVKIDVPHDAQNVLRWYADVSNRPSAAA